MSQPARDRFVPKQLPLFEGRRPDYAQNTFSGSVVASPYDPASSAGTPGFYLVEVATAGVSHDEKATKDDVEFVRTQKQKVVKSYRIDHDRFAELAAELDPQTRLRSVDPETGEITE